jgi:5-methylcytosine-specific restriction endonuclease McrA
LWTVRLASKKQERRAWFDNATLYYASEAWARKRAEVLQRDHYQCQARIDDDCMGRASQAHHLTYRHFRCEPLFELMAVCRNCHETITRMDRAARL